MTSLLGGSLGALYATNLGGARPFGYEGWRFAFFSVAMLSIIIGAACGASLHAPLCIHNNSYGRVHGLTDWLALGMS